MSNAHEVSARTLVGSTAGAAGLLALGYALLVLVFCL